MPRQVELEIRYSYKRAMCELILVAEAERHPDVYEFLVVPQRPPGKVQTGIWKWRAEAKAWVEAAATPQAHPCAQVPSHCLVDVGVSDFAERRAHAHWESLFAIPEAYAGMSLVVQECEKAADLLLITGAFGKNVGLEEFCALQSQTTTNVSGHGGGSLPSENEFWTICTE